MSRRRKLVLLVALALALAASALVLRVLVAGGAFRQVDPHFAGSCRRVLGVTGAEDIVVDREAGRAYLSSADWRAAREGAPRPGAIFLLDLGADARPRAAQHDMAEGLFPHGLSLHRSEAGRLRLFVVNHPTPEASSVEIFVVEGDRLRHERTVAEPEMISLNDVAAVGPDRFYATNDAGTKPDSPLRFFETFLLLPWASVVYFDGTRARVVARGFAYANGVELSADGRTVFVAESTGRRLSAFGRDEDSGALERRGSVSVSTALDNISVAPDGALWLGAHPKMLDFLAHASDPEHLSPSQVLRATYVSGAFSVEEIYLGDGEELSGSSVAVPLEDRFLVGSVFEEGFLDCRSE